MLKVEKRYMSTVHLPIWTVWLISFRLVKHNLQDLIRSHCKSLNIFTLTKTHFEQLFTCDV